MQPETHAVRESTNVRDEASTLFVDIEVDGSRGTLRELVDDAIERELASRGAAAPGIDSAVDAETTLSDQLFRARRVGCRSVRIALSASSGEPLDDDDRRTIRFLTRAMNERPLIVVLDESLLEPPAPIAPPPAPIPTRASTSTSTPTPTSTPTSTPIVAASPSHTVGASVARPDDAWRHWVLQLTAARGPQALAAFERLFSESYMPLANAIAAGLDDPRAKHAHDDFRRAFEKSYTDASATFAATGKRPKMVLDAIDIAHRSARLHGARTTQLLLVDGMRWDVGQLARKKLAPLVASRATLTDDLVLWSALPTTTTRQLVTISRGAEALRAPTDREPELESLRGRTAEMVRRMRVGSRDLYKVDVVEARVREAADAVLEAIPAIAETVARVVAKHAESLPPRTLLFVFGDHGFAIDRGGMARQGGASPEEVLVPAWALLVGDVH